MELGQKKGPRLGSPIEWRWIRIEEVELITPRFDLFYIHTNMIQKNTSKYAILRRSSLILGTLRKFKMIH